MIIPRRALSALVATAAAVALLASFRTPDQATPRTAGVARSTLSAPASTAPPAAQGSTPPPPPPSVAVPTATATPTVAPPASAPPPTASAPAAAATPRIPTPAPPPTPRPAPPPTPRPQPTATPVAASGLHDGTWTGSDVVAGDAFRSFGDVQVQLVISGGRITDVRAVQMPTHARSGQISSSAGPQLRSEVLQAQSARIDTVSGATYTSQAYAQSAQAALDQARA
ncbi:MAG TPA: FMN-binding protein [Candidatus Dormibacteraeota bacterium]|jgi:uncharacterized protein with FMN-binding domain